MATIRAKLKFSVVIAAYNAEPYIADAIESCLGQTFQPCEIIVVDDGSTDGTAAIAEAYAWPVRVIRLAKNGGVAAARNRGVQESVGDWVAFLDADDWFLPEKLEKQRQCALESRVACLIYTAARMITVDGMEAQGRFVPPGELWPMLRYRNPIHFSSVAIRRDAFDALGGFDPLCRNAEDRDLWTRFAFHYTAKAFAAIPETLCVYRRVAGSLSSHLMDQFHHRNRIREKCGLLGTKGLARYLWRRRIAAFNYYDTAIGLREQGAEQYLQFMLKSIVLWPFPWVEMPMRRYKIAAVMVKQRFWSF